MSFKHYRKKPVVIRAAIWHAHLIDYFVKCGVPIQKIHRLDNGLFVYFIDTLEGKHELTDGDYIIQGVKEEYYACKPDIFAMTYKEV